LVWACRIGSGGTGEPHAERRKLMTANMHR
jgi:hypothetical protein